MPAQAPKIDPRSYDDIVRQTRTLVQTYTNWRPPDHHADAGSALIGIFGRMATVVIERLNQAPEKNFLAFLDLIGTQVRPPRPARVPLTFQLATGSPADAVVPARTQIAAPASAGEEEEVVFETDRDLVVTRSHFVAIVAHDPRADQYTDLTSMATGDTDTAYPVFAGATPVEHSLYLARDDFFLLPGPKTVTVTIDSPDPTSAAALRALPMAWEYWDGRAWQRLTATSGGQGNQCVVTLGNPPTPAILTLNNVDARWVRARLERPLPPGRATPSTITSITATRQVSRNGVVPAHAFANGVPLDLSKDFHPLGEQPRLNEALYLSLPEESATPGATVTVNISPSNPLPVPPNPSADLAITWEVWDGAAWQVVSIRESAAGAAKFTARGSATFTLPASLAQRAVNGEPGYWLRARITAGGYGSPATAKVNSQTDKDGHVTAVSVTMEGGYGPPSLAALTVDFTATQRGPLAACFTYNAFTVVDRTAAARTGTSPFSPFIPGAETRPAFYLGVDQPFGNDPMTLYLQVDPPRPGEVADAARQAAPASPPRVRWEYSRAEEWRPLDATDETFTFAESGELRFIGPPTLALRHEFGQRCCWLRARWEDGTFPIPPRLRRVLLNTTWATQATTLQNEILGSSTGDAHQVFRTTQAPALLGQTLEVREPELPSAREQAAIISLEGDQAITVIRDEAGQPEDIWIRWHAVPDFYASGPRDRHYVMDSLTGEVRFGDEQHGLAPPLGRNNVRMALYRTSDGTKGNQAAGTIIQLKTTVPYVESVTNLEAANGGADQESLERVKERGPKALRHQDRAVTAQDFEDLAYEASPEVARVQAFMPAFDPISLEWLPMWHLPLDGPGEIHVEATWPDDQTLAISLSGPGRGILSAHGEGQHQVALTYTVTPNEFVAGDLWRVAIVNRDAQAVRTGQIKIIYPGGTIDTALDAPVNAAYAPTSATRQAGQVELVIVPAVPGTQPTPSLSLISRVRAHLLARSTPTLLLQITEPDWVEVTVSAEVIPLSLEAADVLRATAVTTLARFLHPLTGGFDGRGWPFGRRPHVSDLYAILESVPGVQYVRSLSVVNRPSLADIDPSQPGEAPEDDLTVTRLPRERRERFLIYSGQHALTVAAP